MPSTLATIVLLGAFGGLFYMMTRKGGGCCGGHSGHHSETPRTKEPASLDEPPPQGLEETPKEASKKG